LLFVPVLITRPGFDKRNSRNCPLNSLKFLHWLYRLALSQQAVVEVAPAYAVDQNVLIGLNNDAVRAINAQNYQLAIEKLEQASSLIPLTRMLELTLAIAYNNYGLVFQNNPMEAIKYFHKAVLLDANNATTLQNLSGIIQKMGKNPRSFADRVAIGDACRKAADFVGAIVEYQEALKIKDDGPLHEKLGDVFRVRDENDKAIEQYQAAGRVAIVPQLK
jgi:tetratricopeptide (TPR) repeat protein